MPESPSNGRRRVHFSRVSDVSPSAANTPFLFARLAGFVVSQSVCDCPSLTPRLILFPEERFWLWRLAPLRSGPRRGEGPNRGGRWTAPRPSLRGRGPLLFARSRTVLWMRVPAHPLSFFLSFLSLFVFLPPPYKFAGARLLSDATAALYLDRHPSHSFPSSSFSRTTSETVLGEAFFGLAPLCEENQGIRKEIGGGQRPAAAVSNSIQSFFLGASQTDPFSRARFGVFHLHSPFHKLALLVGWWATPDLPVSHIHKRTRTRI